MHSPCPHRICILLRKPIIKRIEYIIDQKVKSTTEGNKKRIKTDISGSNVYNLKEGDQGRQEKIAKFKQVLDWPEGSFSFSHNSYRNTQMNFMPTQYIKGVFVTYLKEEYSSQGNKFKGSGCTCSLKFNEHQGGHCDW